MLRGNLSSRPFYNDRLVTLALLLVAAVALALTWFNVREIMALSAQRSELAGRIRQYDTQAARFRDDAARVQKSVDRQVLQYLAGATREANILIDERTFSWTMFFGVLEKALPLDVHLVSVAPKTEHGNFRVVMILVARRADDLDQFVQALQDTGAFYDVLPHAQQRNDDGTYGATVESSYYPPDQPAGGRAAKGKTGKGRP